MIDFTSLMVVICTNQRCVIRILGLFDYVLVTVSERNELDQYGDPANEKKMEKAPWEMLH